MTETAFMSEELAALRLQLKGFLRAATHELNTPLGVIQHMIFALEPRIAGCPEIGLGVAGIQREVGRLITVVNDLSLRNELENGTVAVNPVPVDVGSMLAELLSEVKSRHPEREPSADAPPTLPCVQADPDHLRFILWTLLHNAARSSTAELKELVLRIEREPGGRFIRFSVDDDAPALVAGYEQCIFDALPDLPPALNRPSYALGTGLCPARELARRMGGDLWVERPPGAAAAAQGGNVFVLHLPAANMPATTQAGAGKEAAVP